MNNSLWSVQFLINLGPLSPEQSRWRRCVSGKHSDASGIRWQILIEQRKCCETYICFSQCHGGGVGWWQKFCKLLWNPGGGMQGAGLDQIAQVPACTCFLLHGLWLGGDWRLCLTHGRRLPWSTDGLGCFPAVVPMDRGTNRLGLVTAMQTLLLWIRRADLNWLLPDANHGAKLLT